MTQLFHTKSLLVSILALSFAASSGITVAKAEDNHFFGRWSVKDEKPVYSAKGKFYKTIDIAPCFADFCGVAVNDDMTCGPTLFRFIASHGNNQMLTGHGKWGKEKKKLQLAYFAPTNAEVNIEIGLGGDDFDFESREGSMPTFDANYTRKGESQCRADGAKVSS